MVGYVAEWYGRLGLLGRGPVRPGRVGQRVVWQAWSGVASQGQLGNGNAGLGRQGLARFGPVCRGAVWQARCVEAL